MMKEPVLSCQNEQRRHDVRAHGELNGLDYLEIVGDRTLRVYFLGKAPEGLTQANVRITGGQRIRDIEVVGFRMCTRQEAWLDDCMVVTVNQPGDFSTYTLCVVTLDAAGRPTDQPFPSLDPRYACLDFHFHIDCPTELDCKRSRVCPPKVYPEPEIDYLAKDYASFRQLILDRLALVMPDWQERHVPDLGITLVELLAYAGDHLSYYQDAVATEAYLHTARQRISVRRHARLVDYNLHEGNNARTWVHVSTESDETLERDKLSFITGYNEALSVRGRVLTWEDLEGLPSGAYEVFEPLFGPGPKSGEIRLRRAHNEIRFHTWGDLECCLPQGATRATLKDGTASWIDPDDEQTAVQQGPKTEESAGGWQIDRGLQLQPGDVVIFEEVIGPRTGNRADADPARRHAVRLTRVEAGFDELYGQPVLEIGWAEADALPFPFCISVLGPPPDCELLEDVSVVRGNVLLVDHGRRVSDEVLGCVPLKTTEVECECEGVGQASVPFRVPGQFRPHLQRTPLTFWEPPLDGAPASHLLWQEPRQALPWIRLSSVLAPDCVAGQPGNDGPAGDMGEGKEAEEAMQAQAGTTGKASPAQGGGDDYQGPPAIEWEPRFDLLSSGSQDRHFVVEIDNRRQAHLRFGDGELGALPEAATRFTTSYRVGNGPAGNVGAEAISHLVYADLLSGVSMASRNPLPASGGTAPETLAQAKLLAPDAFRAELQRAIMPEDYAAIVMRDFADEVQRAAAVFRWMGSWYEVLVAVDPLGQVPADRALLGKIETHLRDFRRIGHDVVVRAAVYVPLDVEMTICVHPHFLRGHVKAALLGLFSNRRLPDGRLGFFHPDQLTFGEGIRLSRLVAAAQAVDGVDNVVVTRLEHLHQGPNGEIEAGLLKLGPLEIARLDNDPSMPENGRLKLSMEGGR